MSHCCMGCGVYYFKDRENGAPVRALTAEDVLSAGEVGQGSTVVVSPAQLMNMHRAPARCNLLVVFTAIILQQVKFAAGPSRALLREGNVCTLACCCEPGQAKASPKLNHAAALDVLVA